MNELRAHAYDLDVLENVLFVVIDNGHGGNAGRRATALASTSEHIRAGISAPAAAPLVAIALAVAGHAHAGHAYAGHAHAGHGHAAYAHAGRGHAATQ